LIAVGQISVFDCWNELDDANSVGDWDLDIAKRGKCGVLQGDEGV
jgi:hypothetical protein